MLPPGQLEIYEKRMTRLEQEELVCAWRFHGGQTPRGRLQALRRLKRGAIGTVRSWKDVQRPRPGQIVILLHAATSATWGTVKPVLSELKRRGNAAFLVTSANARQVLQEQLHDGHATVEQLLQTPDRTQRRELQDRARSLAMQLRKVFSPLPDGGAETWLAQGLLCRAAAREWVGGAGVVLADCDIEAWRKGFILGAREAGVPTVVMQHGIFGPHHFPVHAGYLFTWGAYFCRDAERYGLDGVVCEPTGCPRWDFLGELRKGPKDRQLLNRLNLDPDRPVVLLISNAHGVKSYPEHYEPYFEGVRRLLESDLQILLRLHPAEKDLRYYAPRIPAGLLDRAAICPDDVDLYSCLKAADVIYHVFSAAALEAMALGVPVLFERGAAQEQLCDYPDHGGGAWTRAGTVVEQCRDLARPGPNRRSLVETQDKFCFNALENLGSATKVVVDRLEELAEHGETVCV